MGKGCHCQPLQSCIETVWILRDDRAVGCNLEKCAWHFTTGILQHGLKVFLFLWCFHMSFILIVSASASFLISSFSFHIPWQPVDFTNGHLSSYVSCSVKSRLWLADMLYDARLWSDCQIWMVGFPKSISHSDGGKEQKRGETTTSAQWSTISFTSKGLSAITTPLHHQIIYTYFPCSHYQT